MHLRFASPLALAALLLAAHPALADEAPSASAVDSAPLFGQQGHLTLNVLGAGVGGVSLGGFNNAPQITMTGLVSYGTTTGDDGVGQSSSLTQLALTPSFDYFVTDHLTLGGQLSVGYNRTRYSQTEAVPAGVVAGTTETTTAVSLGARPRIGYVIPITDGISLWPRVGVGLDYANQTDDYRGKAHSFTVSAAADLGVVIALGRRAYLDVGPTFSVASSSLTVTSTPLTTMGSPGGFAAGGGALATLGLVF